MEEHVCVTTGTFPAPVWLIVSLVLSLKQPDDIKKHLSGFRSSCRQSCGGGFELMSWGGIRPELGSGLAVTSGDW